MISEKGWELSNRDLNAFRAAGLFASGDPEKPGIDALRIEDGRLISTDTHRLFCYSSSSLKAIPPVTIHADVARRLQDHPQERTARLHLTQKEAVLRFKSGSEVRTSLVAEEFPPTWEKVAPQSYEFRVAARTGDWLSAIEILARQRDLARDNRLLIVLSPREQRVILRQGESSTDGPAWEASASFPAKFLAGEKDLVIAVNSQYLEQAVSAQGSLPEEQLEFLANHELGAFTIRSADASDVFVVTMPMARDPVPEPQQAA